MAEANQPGDDIVEEEKLVKDRGKEDQEEATPLPNCVRSRASAKEKSNTLPFRRRRTPEKTKEKSDSPFWTFRFAKKHLPGRLKKGKKHGLPDTTQSVDSGTCVCTGYKRTEDHVLGPGVVFLSNEGEQGFGESETDDVNSPSTSRKTSVDTSDAVCIGAMPMAAISNSAGRIRLQTLMTPIPPPPVPQQGAANQLPETDASSIEEWPEYDVDEWLIAQRRRDIERGVEISPNQLASSSSSGYPHFPSIAAIGGAANSLASLATSFQNQVLVSPSFQLPVFENSTFHTPDPCAGATASAAMSASTITSPGAFNQAGYNSSFLLPSMGAVHTQVDYIHCLVPDLRQITDCSFYWGVMDRYEAERLLDNRPEGTFLLRDSAQEEFLFSVSFRRYGRSLHARIEQWNHKFSFDSHDPGVFAANTVCGLIEHYKDPSCCMFFEPMLTLPLNRNYPFSLQHLCRSVVCSNVAYDGVNRLPLPTSLRDYLKYYHYKQKVRVRRFDIHH